MRLRAFGLVLVWMSFITAAAAQQALPSSKSYASHFTFQCDAPYLGNLFWTVQNLRNLASDHRKFWEKRFGISDEDRQQLRDFARVMRAYRSRYRQWDGAATSLAISQGPLTGLFMSPASSLEHAITVVFCTSEDLGEVRYKLTDFVSNAEVNMIVSTVVRFMPHFDVIWNDVQQRQRDYATKVETMLKKHQPSLAEFFKKAAAFYGTSLEKSVHFKVHFFWSPAERGGISILADKHIFCETSQKDDAERFALSIAHEVCHYLSAMTPARLKFRRSDAVLSKGIYFPITFVEEVLATALAQGVLASKIAPRLAASDGWVSHFGGKVDKVARALMPMLQKMLVSGEPLSERWMTEIAALCQKTLTPRPADYANVSLLLGTSANTERFEDIVPDEMGLRSTINFPISQFPNFPISQFPNFQIPEWLNRIYLVSADSDGLLLNGERWILPIERTDFDALRQKHDLFILTVRKPSRLEFVLYAKTDDALTRVIEHFKGLEQVQEGVQAVP